MKIDPNKENQDRAMQIKEAIAASGKKKSVIAAELDVKPQAITGWETTGRIHRTMLRKLGHVLGKNLSSDEATIDDLDDDTKQVIKLMEMTDAEGRMRARFAVSDTLRQYALNKQASISASGGLDIPQEMFQNEDFRKMLFNLLKQFSNKEIVKKHY